MRGFLSMKKNRAHTASSRLDDIGYKLTGLIAAIGVAIALLWSAAANAQTDTPQGEDPPGDMESNGVTPPPETIPGDNGVIKPPDVGDEEINQPAPDPDPGTTPVIPPDELPEQPEQ